MLFAACTLFQEEHPEPYIPRIMYLNAGEICLAKIDGSDLQKVNIDITHSSLVAPTVTPDGKYIIASLEINIEQDISLHQIFIMEPNGSNPVNLSDSLTNDYAIDISSDGETILYMAN